MPGTKEAKRLIQKAERAQASKGYAALQEKVKAGKGLTDKEKEDLLKFGKVLGRKSGQRKAGL